jgi:hypothetical protein
MFAIRLMINYRDNRKLSVDELQNVAQRLFNTAQCVAKDQTYLIGLAYYAWGEREASGRFASYKQPESGEVVTCYQLRKTELMKEDGQFYKKRTSKVGTDLQEGMNRYLDLARALMQQLTNPKDLRLCEVTLEWQFPIEQFNAIKEMAIQLPEPNSSSALLIHSSVGSFLFWKCSAEGHPMASRPEFWLFHSTYAEVRAYTRIFSTLKEALEFVQPHLYAWDRDGDNRVIEHIREFVEEKLQKAKKAVS